MNKRCKFCKSMIVTIVPPSTEQYCARKKCYVKLNDICNDFVYNEEMPKKIKEYGDIE